MGDDEMTNEDTFDSYNGVAECGDRYSGQETWKEGHWKGMMGCQEVE